MTEITIIEDDLEIILINGDDDEGTKVIIISAEGSLFDQTS